MYNYVAETVAVLFGAGKEARTPDLLLGKQMYYQLYYTRIILFTILVGVPGRIWTDGFSVLQTDALGLSATDTLTWRAA